MPPTVADADVALRNHDLDSGVAIGLSPLGPALLGPPSLALSGVGVSHLFELQVMTQVCPRQQK